MPRSGSGFRKAIEGGTTPAGDELQTTDVGPTVVEWVAGEVDAVEVERRRTHQDE